MADDSGDGNKFHQKTQLIEIDKLLISIGNGSLPAQQPQPEKKSSRGVWNQVRETIASEKKKKNAFTFIFPHIIFRLS